MRIGRVAPDPVQVVADSPLLRAFDRGSLRGLALEWVVLGSGEVLQLRRAGGDALYFVAFSRVEIVEVIGEFEPAVTGEAPALTSVVAGDVIGDMRTLMGTRDLAMAALRAVTPTHLVKLVKEQFDDYVANIRRLVPSYGTLSLHVSTTASWCRCSVTCSARCRNRCWTKSSPG